MKVNNDFLNLGYTIIDNFLPLSVAKELQSMYLNETNWEFFSQERPDHYKHVFKLDSTYHPQDNESYSARFNRSSNLEDNPKIKEIFNQYFIPQTKEISNLELTDFDMRCMSLNKEDHYRTHIDSYAGKVNIIYYINEKWIWDWGGILHIGSTTNDEFIKPILPKFNRCIFLYNEKFNAPHFVSAVAQFAQNSRYSLVSFNK